ncbi:FAD-dependent oxidoreductase [Sporomusa sp. KB1]|uniref:oxidoreductase n=1 Tax=Sporomusa sp. KB1 TaxID=943346 RepID=UPI0011AAE90B|nr:FAD-dependent oxidoreductase [Sporomusa sp. KB1]TWH51933.1 2,4-dienoyl-CoA reductase-like NADH-dependent reductase (Old Yellow Enzyme family) [Sporomusa sp. KB1]
MLDNLFSTLTIKGKTLKNRCVVPPMVTNYCNADGTATEKFAAYHEAKAKGGFAMIITEDFAVTPGGKGFTNLPGLWNDGQIPGFAEFTKRIHKYGALIIAQIYHCGRQTSKAVCGQAPWAPSAIPCPFSSDMPHEMTIDEIKLTVSQYGDCARRAKEAGFDGIEIHGGHGYLIAQFMSPYSNKRTDIYGGALQNRIRFALEIIADIRAKCGDDFIVGYRISGDEYVTGGRTIEDTKTIIPYIEAEGIDYVHVTAGVYRTFDAVIPSQYCRHGWIADLAAEVKKVSKVPVITVGRVNDPRIANTILASGKADLVSMGRQSLSDPETPNKAKEGRFDDICTCIGCHHGCIGNLMLNKPIKCILNPTLGMESEYPDIKIENPKNVMVIGAGPGGLAAAVSAASCGHKVKVYEKNRWAGGQFRLGAVPAGKGEIINFINWQLNELNKLGVPVALNTEVMLDLVKAENPDIIIAATGAEPIIPRIPGADKANVVTAHSVLSGAVNTGNRIVVIGGGCVGAETANHLAAHLKSVTLVEMLDNIAMDEIIVPRWGLLEELSENKVRICTGTTVKEIMDGAVKVSGAVNEEIPADTVVLAVGAESVNGFANALKEEGYNVRIIGDALKVGLAGEAVSRGFELGREL